MQRGKVENCVVLKDMWASRDLNRPVPSDAESAVSSYSVTSTFRHSGNFNPPQESAKSKLTKDASHKPKTHGSFGVLVVGLGGANGATMLGKSQIIQKVQLFVGVFRPHHFFLLLFVVCSRNFGKSSQN